MTWIAVAVAGAGLVGGVLSSNAQRDAADTAAGAQSAASASEIAARQAQFDAIQKLLAPYNEAGVKALGAQGDLAGINGQQAQRDAILGIQNSPEFVAMQQQGNEAILQNASATGGLRGGNTQAALAQFQPQLLAQLIQQQYSRLGGLTSVGQNAAAGVGNAGMNTVNGISGALQQQGAAAAGAALAGGRADAGLWGSVGNSVGLFAGLGGFNGLGGGSYNYRGSELPYGLRGGM